MSLDEDVLARAARVRLLLMDVDGVMTDGTYWQVPDGQGGLAEIKAFDSQDGIAFQWLRRFGIQAGVISGRVSVATEERARTAGFTHVYQGHTEKIPILEEILEKSGLAAEQVGYVGDDFTDVVVMHRVGFARRDRERQARGEAARPLGDHEPGRPRRAARRGRAPAQGPGPLGRHPAALRARHEGRAQLTDARRPGRSGLTVDRDRGSWGRPSGTGRRASRRGRGSAAATPYPVAICLADGRNAYSIFSLDRVLQSALASANRSHPSRETIHWRTTSSNGRCRQTN